MSGGRNPLRSPLDRRLTRIAGPSALVLFGVTGDLARKKLLPAIYDLAHRGLLPPSFSLVGFGRRDWTDEQFTAEVRSSVEAAGDASVLREAGLTVVQVHLTDRRAGVAELLGAVSSA